MILKPQIIVNPYARVLIDIISMNFSFYISTKYLEFFVITFIILQRFLVL
jgi:hypothetical protein